MPVAVFYICPAINPDTGEPYIVRDPITYAILPATGAWKPKNTYWLRRLANEEVYECTPPEGSVAPSM